jgi:RNA recognition motif-containing protein
MRTEAVTSGPDEQLSLTAIVIKNIPFEVEREDLVQIMKVHDLPVPYAFNYYYEGGVFRGLAFANFITPQAAEAVIEGLNCYKLRGWTLRVEYKKMLPSAEWGRIGGESERDAVKPLLHL